MEFETYLEIAGIKLPVTIEFDVDPGQKLIMYGDYAQEGIEPEIEINSVTHKGKDVLISEETGDALRQECWDYLEGLEEAAAEMEAESRAEAHDRQLED